MELGHRPQIQVSNLSKRYALGEQGTTTLREAFAEAWITITQRRTSRRLVTHQEFWALNNISFEIPKGQILGIIGRNGSGKSTLLRILSRITEPTSGRAIIRGRVSSILEVGTGFHPDLSGRENIFLNGTLIGMKRCEIMKQFDAIVDFAELAEFIDTPVKRYSTGMYIRLAFSIAAHLNPEVLIIDEALAVGDFAFQNRCLKKSQASAADGKTVMLVSHDMNTVQKLCDRVLWLSHGKLQDEGLPETVIPKYLSECTA